MTGRQRIAGYDISKGLAMFLVVMLHYAFTTQYYSDGIAGSMVTTLCMICVPLFFAVNGALLLPRPLDVHKHVRKTVTIIAVLVVWKIIVTIFGIVVDGATYTFTFKDFLGFLFSHELGNYPLTGYMWFMNALIAIYLIYPLIKLMFDDNGAALKATVGVLLTFTVGKDTLVEILNMLGVLSHHEFSSILDKSYEFYIFGSYGYTLLYFIVGGMIARKMTVDGKIQWPCVKFTRTHAVIALVLSYVLLFAFQRFQHATEGINLYVKNGYWLFPTFAMTVLFLMLSLTVNLRSGMVQKTVTLIGKNTFGIYMLQSMAIQLLVKAQSIPAVAAIFQWKANTGWLITLISIAATLFLFLCCLLVSAILGKIPVVRKLFAV